VTITTKKIEKLQNADNRPSTIEVLAGIRLLGVMEQRLFGYCPFSGIICLPCSKAITAEGKNKVEYNMGAHVATKSHKRNCADQEVTAAERRAFVALANKKLFPVAMAVMARDDVAGKRQLLAPFLMKPVNFLYCGECNKYFDKKRKDRNRAHHDTMVEASGHCPVSLSGSSLVIPADYDPLNFAIYSKLFRELLEKARSELDGLDVSEIERNSYDNVARRSTMVHNAPQAKRAKRTPIIRAGADPIESQQPTKEFVPTLNWDPRVLQDILKYDRLSGVDHTDSQSQFLRELEGFGAPGKNNSWIIEWVQDLGFPRIAVDQFDNSFVKMAQFMVSASDGAAYNESAHWQGAVSQVCELWLEVCSDQLSGVNPELKGRVMRVGDYDRTGSARSVKEIMSSVGESFLEARAEEDDADLEGDDAGESNRVPAIIARDGEAILNELLKISDGDPTASLHKRLRPLAKTTRDRYEKFLVRYILFCGRYYSRFSGSNQLWDTLMKPSLDNFQNAIDSEDPSEINADSEVAQKAIFALNWFILSTAEVGLEPTYGDSVIFRYTLPGIFARSCGVSGVNPLGGQPMFTLTAPNNVQNAAAGLLYLIRLSFVTAMVHAAAFNNANLQRLLSSPRVLVQARPMLDLSNVIMI
jgi:hypothetical protein